MSITGFKNEWSTPSPAKIAGCMVCLLLFIAGSVQLTQAQEKNWRHYKVRLGFYAGPVNYIGDYNPWLVGSSYTYIGENGETTTDKTWRTGDLNFGFWTKVMIKEFLYVRGNVGFGTLTYQLNDRDYRMSTQYSSFGGALELVGNSDGSFQPYLSAGLDVLQYKAPRINRYPGFSPYSNQQLGTSLSAISYPVTLGFNYQVTNLTSIFVEASFSLTDTDELDNLALPPENMDSKLQNDAILSYRAGIGVSLIDLIRLNFNKRNKEKARRTQMFQPDFTSEPIASDLEGRALVPDDSLEATRRRLYPDQFGQQPIAEEPPEDTTEKIAVVDPENREFEAEEEVEKARQMKEEMEEKLASGEIENTPEARARIPRIVIKPKPMNLSVNEQGVVTTDPPEGYYVQAYASVGPQSAQRARNMVMDELSDILESPEKQVIITKREQFYEVRVGVFDSYDDTIGVLQEIQGTFFDAYTLIFVPEEDT